jgi:hypothetical protein
VDQNIPVAFFLSRNVFGTIDYPSYFFWNRT